MRAGRNNPLSTNHISELAGLVSVPQFPINPCSGNTYHDRVRVRVDRHEHDNFTIDSMGLFDPRVGLRFDPTKKRVLRTALLPVWAHLTLHSCDF